MKDKFKLIMFGKFYKESKGDFTIYFNANVLQNQTVKNIPEKILQLGDGFLSPMIPIYKEISYYDDSSKSFKAIIYKLQDFENDLLEVFMKDDIKNAHTLLKWMHNSIPILYNDYYWLQVPDYIWDYYKLKNTLEDYS